MAGRIFAVLLAVVSCLPWPTVAAEAAKPDEPRVIITRFHDTLLDCMRQAKSLGFQGRYNKLAAEVGQDFNIPAMTGMAVGRQWNNLTPEQRQALTDAFGRFTVTNYARRFDGYDGERFEITGERQVPDGVFVDSRLVPSDGDPTDFNYLFRQADGRWGIVDIYLGGTASEMAIRRSEYSAVLRRDGPQGLIDLLRRKVVELTPTP